MVKEEVMKTGGIGVIGQRTEGERKSKQGLDNRRIVLDLVITPVSNTSCNKKNTLYKKVRQICLL